MRDDEATCILQAQQGNPQAFGSLVDLYQRPVNNLCYRMLGNAEDAEDAAQETFLRAFKAIRRYDINRSFLTWLLSIAAHYCIDQIRRQKVPLVSVEDLPYPDLPDPEPGVEAAYFQKEDRSRIQKVLGVLDATDRAAVIMFYWNDFSYEEISKALSLTISAVKSRLHRARRAMAMQWIENQEKMDETVFLQESLIQEGTRS